MSEESPRVAVVMGSVSDWALSACRESSPGRDVSRPADVSDSLRLVVEDYIRRLLHLDYVGVMALEHFDTGGSLSANEVAPRVHNSGHWTIEGAGASQFENHIRAITDAPLGGCEAIGYSVMLNIVGSLPSDTSVLAVPGAHLHVLNAHAKTGARRARGASSVPGGDLLRAGAAGTGGMTARALAVHRPGRVVGRLGINAEPASRCTRG